MFDVGCLDLEVRTFVVYGCSNVGGRDYEVRNDKICPNGNCSSVV